MIQDPGKTKELDLRHAIERLQCEASKHERAFQIDNREGDMMLARMNRRSANTLAEILLCEVDDG